MLRRFLGIALMTAVAASATTMARADDQTIKIGVAAGASDMLPVYVAIDKGFFAKHGIKADVTVLANPSVGPANLMSDSIDISMASPSTLVQAVAGGLDLVAVSGDSQHSKDDYVMLMAKEGSGINGAKDLVGKKLGMPGLGGTLDIVMRAWLKKNDVKPDDVDIVEVFLPQVADVMKSGQIDAAAVVTPFNFMIEKAGIGHEVSKYLADVDPTLLGAIWISKRDWAEAHKDLLAEYRAALDEAMDFIGSNADESKAIQVKYLKFPSPVPPLSTDISPADLKKWGDLMADIGQLKGDVSYDTMVLQ